MDTPVDLIQIGVSSALLFACWFDSVNNYSVLNSRRQAAKTLKHIVVHLLKSTPQSSRSIEFLDFVRKCVSIALYDKNATIREAAGEILLSFSSAWKIDFEIVTLIVTVSNHESQKDAAEIDPTCARRLESIEAFTNICEILPNQLTPRIDIFIKNLTKLTDERIGENQKMIVNSLVVMLEQFPILLKPFMNQIVEYIILVMDSYDEVALEAAEFWAYFSEYKDEQQLLQPYLKRLISVLLVKMIRSDVDNFGTDDNIWSLRKCAALSLDSISNIYGKQIWENDEIFFDPARKMLEISEKHREASILAFGAVSNGFGTSPEFREKISDYVHFLIKELQNASS
ncbi:Transportin-1, partial [Nowakowskiella sp. JEL0078]